MKEFKDKLKEKRSERGLSQQKLAEKIFVSRSAVAKWENGLGYPSVDCREKLKELFEVGDDFFRAEDPDGRMVAVLMRVRGEKADHWFVQWSSSVVALDESGMQTQYRKLTDRITVNGRETVLQYYSYFPMSDELVTIAVDGTEMSLKPYY